MDKEPKKRDWVDVQEQKMRVKLSWGFPQSLVRSTKPCEASRNTLFLSVTEVYLSGFYFFVIHGLMGVAKLELSCQAQTELLEDCKVYLGGST